MTCPHYPEAEASMTRYHVQKLDGYTDGRESWITIAKLEERDLAEITMNELTRRHPWKMRVRKIVRRSGHIKS
jgi:hypothetical protein